MTLDDERLDGPAGLGARALCMALLDTAQETHGQLGDGADANALHDFRVAVRRLRTGLRACEALLPPAAGRKPRRKLGKLARATAVAREADVEMTWLAAHREHAAPKNQPAIDWLVAHVTERRQGCCAKFSAEVDRPFHKAAIRLRARLLSRNGHCASAEIHAPLGQAIANLLLAQANALGQALATATRGAEIAAVHIARIEAKRLRYLLDPLRNCQRADSTQVVATLRELQDVLGDLHDAVALCDAIGDALPKAAAAEARRLHGVVADGGTQAALKAGRKDDLIAGLLALDVAAHERL